MRHRATLLWVGLTLVWWVGLPIRQADPSVHIQTPSNGQSLFGVISILGTANNAAMQTYRLEYLSQADLNGQWQPVAKPVAQQVTNGILGQWDTTALPDGVYGLRLRVSLRNGTILEDYVRDLKISNQQPTPLPTIPPSETPLQSTLPPTAGPSPSPLIQQPPLSTVRAAGLGLPVNTPVPGAPILLPNGAAQGALCMGVLITLVAFLLLGAYVAIRERIRQTPA